MNKSAEPKQSVALVKMIPQIYGKPCACVSAHDGSVYVSRKIYGISVEWSSIGKSIGYDVQAQNSWIDAVAQRPESLTDGLYIGSDCLEVGECWWFDNYFRWYFVFEPKLVARSTDGDHSWVADFLRARARRRNRERKVVGRKRP